MGKLSTFPLESSRESRLERIAGFDVRQFEILGDIEDHAFLFPGEEFLDDQTEKSVVCQLGLLEVG